MHLADESPPSFSFVPVAYKETGVKTNNQKGFSTFLFQSFGMAISFHYKIKSTFQWPEITFFPGLSSLLVPYTPYRPQITAQLLMVTPPSCYTTCLLKLELLLKRIEGSCLISCIFLVTWFHMVAVEQMGGGGVEVKCTGKRF